MIECDTKSNQDVVREAVAARAKDVDDEWLLLEMMGLTA